MSLSKIKSCVICILGWNCCCDTVSGDVVDLSDAADFADSILDVVLVGVVWETADVDLSHWVHHS